MLYIYSITGISIKILRWNLQFHGSGHDTATPRFSWWAAGSVAFLSLRDDRKKTILRRLEGLAHRRPWRQPLVIVPTPFRRLIGVVLGAATLLLPTSLAAQGAAPDNAQI